MNEIYHNILFQVSAVRATITIQFIGKR